VTKALTIKERDNTISALVCLAAEGTTLQINMVKDPFSTAQGVTVAIDDALLPMNKGKKERFTTMSAVGCRLQRV